MPSAIHDHRFTMSREAFDAAVAGSLKLIGDNEPFAVLGSPDQLAVGRIHENEFRCECYELPVVQFMTWAFLTERRVVTRTLADVDGCSFNAIIPGDNGVSLISRMIVERIEERFNERGFQVVVELRSVKLIVPVWSSSSLNCGVESRIGCPSERWNRIDRRSSAS